MLLRNIRGSIPRVVIIGLALAASIPFDGGGVVAGAIGTQGKPQRSNTAEQFAGTWHWIFDGKSFLILIRSGGGFTGTVTPSRIALDDEGGLLRADPGKDAAPKPIASARLEGSALRVTVTDGFQFVMKLKDSTHAEIRPIAAPVNMKPIKADKVD